MGCVCGRFVNINRVRGGVEQSEEDGDFEAIYSGDSIGSCDSFIFVIYHVCMCIICQSICLCKFFR